MKTETLKPGEQVIINGPATIMLGESRRGRAKLLIYAPDSTKITRGKNVKNEPDSDCKSRPESAE